MRRTKDISKRIAVAILAAALMMTSTSATVLLNPTVVYAGDVDDNNDTSGNVDVSEGDHMTNNNGKIDENKGTIDHNNSNGSVKENYGMIGKNYGDVSDNKAKQSEDVGAGYVRENYGTITTNNGAVGDNRKYNDRKGKIETNNGSVAGNGTGLTNGSDDGNGIRTNKGDVSTNYENGYIDDNQGAVHTNKGLINTNEGNDATIDYAGYIAKGVHDNEGTITDNTGLVDTNKRQGTVTNNNGTVKTNYGTVTNNSGKITTNDVTTINNNLYTGKVDNNNGEIATNNGLVTENHGFIENNAGNEKGDDGYTAVKGVSFNMKDGEISTNSGYVQQNLGAIDTNDTTGYVNSNFDGNRTDSHAAIIKVNKGTVYHNGETVTLNTGDIIYNEGTVTNNFGDVGNCGDYTNDGTNYHPITSYIVNQYDGTLTEVAAQGAERNNTVITNFFGGTISGDGFDVENNFSDQNITATNQYRSVSFVADEVSTRFSTDYGTGFTDKTLMNPDGTDGTTKYYINVTGGNGSGTITIVAEDGYEVKQSGQASVTGFDYTLTKQGNNYVLNITGYNGNSIELSPQMFGLVVSAIEQANDPTDPTDPAGPTNPVNPVNPTAPADPVNPADPVIPVTPVNPVNPVDPAPQSSPENDPNPVNIVDPITPVKPVTSVDPLAPALIDSGFTNGLANEAAIIAEINAMPASGGAVSVPNLAQTGLSASIVEALVAKNDAPINLTYTVGGITYMLVIPAGFNLLTLINAYGGIDFATLIAVFGASIVG